MHVREDESVPMDAGCADIRQLHPAIANIDAAFVESPQHGCGVANVEVLLGVLTAKLRVVEMQYFVVLLQFQVKERQMPP